MRQNINNSGCTLRIIDLKRGIKKKLFNPVNLNRLVEVKLRLKRLTIVNKRR